MPVNRKMMSAMKKEYGNKKGERVYYATENKMKKTKYHGSGTFSKADEAKGYKTYCTASELSKMDSDRYENVKEYTLASRRESTKGSAQNRKVLRRSESTKGKY